MCVEESVISKRIKEITKKLTNKKDRRMRLNEENKAEGDKGIVVVQKMIARTRS